MKKARDILAIMFILILTYYTISLCRSLDDTLRTIRNDFEDLKIQTIAAVKDEVKDIKGIARTEETIAFNRELFRDAYLDKIDKDVDRAVRKRMK